MPSQPIYGALPGSARSFSGSKGSERKETLGEPEVPEATTYSAIWGMGGGKAQHPFTRSSQSPR
jgi:hypothetical protein